MRNSQSNIGRLSSVTLAALFLLSPAVVSAQTPEPAAGMASPSNEANIPKGSNPNSGSGNLSAGSGATPSSTASDNSMPSQTGNNPQSSINDSRPSQTATNPDVGMSSGDQSSSSPADGASPMAQGQYAAPPTTDVK